MSLNEFILAFISVVIGLGVADLLTSFHRLLRAHDRVKWDWLTIANAALMLYLIVAFWWWHFDYPGPGRTLTVAKFLPVFGFLVTSFLMVAAALPDEVPEKGLDLRSFYLETLQYRWVLVVLSTLVSQWGGIFYVIASQDWSILDEIAISLSCAAVAATAIYIRAIWFQWIAITWIFVVFCYYNLFFEIGP